MCCISFERSLYYISTNRDPSANGDERQQILLLIERIKIETVPVSRPKKRFKVFAVDKVYDVKYLRQKLRSRGMRAQFTPFKVYNACPQSL